jgi:hypothetical protein
LSRLLVVAYFLEMGLVLTVVPWSVFWERNFFAESVPGLLPVIQNNFIRGAVSGLGIVNLMTGLSDLAGLVFRRRLARPGDEAPAHLNS